MSIRRIISVGFFVTAGIIVSFGLVVSIVLRDGLGADSISSTGVIAITRVVEKFWPFFVLCAALAGIGYIVGRAPNNQSKKVPASQAGTH
jgi:hypothetical protein